MNGSEEARHYFERRMQGYDLAKSDRGFYTNKYVYGRWQDFWAGWLARTEREPQFPREVLDDLNNAQEILQEILHGKVYE